MNRTTLPLALVAALLTGAAQAQTPAPVMVTQPASPAPTVTSTPAANTSSGPAAAPESSVSAPTGVTQIVYTPQLPKVADLTNAAAAQGYTVERVVQTANQVVVFYRNANGQATTVAYQSLPPSAPTSAPAQSSPPVVVTAPPAPVPVVVTAPPAVVYEQAPRVIYYDSYPDYYYYPRIWYPPVSLSFGFGYRSFHGGYGGYHGGYRHR